MQLCLIHHVHTGKHLDGIGMQVAVQDVGHGCLCVEAASCCFLSPFLAVSVAVEVYWLAGLDVLTQYGEDGLGGLHTGCYVGVHALLEIGQGLCNGGIEDYQCCGAVLLRAYGAELESVAGECKGAGAVTVGIVEHQLRYLGDVQAEGLLGAQVDVLMSLACLQLGKDLIQLASQEGADDERGCLVGSQAVCIGCAYDAGLEQGIVLVNGHQRLDDEGYEAQVVQWCLAGLMQGNTCIGHQGPVVMLSRSVDAGKGLLVQQATEGVLAGNALHESHEQHIVVNCDVGFLEDGGKLELVRCDLVMAGLARYAQFQGLYLQILHEGCDA